ncbi:unnamed protein product [Mesocestoides corti]|uniref:Uncharacterized protein n=1 Tax=Mesocestoides corti TaxID=53468 RepID=A0A0R3UHI1_MESCO|nr:unnamed protein product [Mesocestoides corti]
MVGAGTSIEFSAKTPCEFIEARHIHPTLSCANLSPRARVRAPNMGSGDLTCGAGSIVACLDNMLQHCNKEVSCKQELLRRGQLFQTQQLGKAPGITIISEELCSSLSRPPVMPNPQKTAIIACGGEIFSRERLEVSCALRNTDQDAAHRSKERSHGDVKAVSSGFASDLTQHHHFAKANPSSLGVAVLLPSSEEPQLSAMGLTKDNIPKTEKRPGHHLLICYQPRCIYTGPIFNKYLIISSAHEARERMCEASNTYAYRLICPRTRVRARAQGSQRLRAGQRQTACVLARISGRGENRTEGVLIHPLNTPHARPMHDAGCHLIGRPEATVLRRVRSQTAACCSLLSPRFYAGLSKGEAGGRSQWVCSA